MISRIWHGYTAPCNADAYEMLLKEEIFTGIQGRKIPGYVGIQLLRRAMGEEVEFVTVMWFETLEAVKIFAGKTTKPLWCRLKPGRSWPISTSARSITKCAPAGRPCRKRKRANHKGTKERKESSQRREESKRENQEFFLFLLQNLFFVLFVNFVPLW